MTTLPYAYSIYTTTCTGQKTYQTHWCIEMSTTSHMPPPREILKWVNVQLFESQVSLLVKSSRFTTSDQPGIDGISFSCGTPVPRWVEVMTAGSQRGRQWSSVTIGRCTKNNNTDGSDFHIYIYSVLKWTTLKYTMRVCLIICTTW